MVGACLKRSVVWSHVTLLKLTENMRAQGDAQFATWLLDIGHGRHIRPNGDIKLPQQMCVQAPYQPSDDTPEKKEQRGIDTLIRDVYPDLHIPHEDSFFLERNILSSRNEDVDDLNHRMLEIFPGQTQEFCSVDTVVFEEGADGDPMHLLSEYLQSLSPSGIPLGRLKVKPGCPLMLLRNLDPSEGLCNGTRLRLLTASNRVLEATILGGAYSGKRVFIPRIPMMPSQTALPFKLKRLQFPVKVAFSMTINKSQGQSIKKVGLDLRTPVFSHGQLYVALSRATTQDGVGIFVAT